MEDFMQIGEAEKASLYHTEDTSCHGVPLTAELYGIHRWQITFAVKTDMEIVIIEKKAFEALLSGIGTLTEKVHALHDRCGDKRLSNWMDGEDVCRLLHISPRTLQTLRDNRLIGHAQINRKFYYKPQEVERLLPVIDQFRTEKDMP